MTSIHLTPCCGLQVIDDLEDTSPKILADICKEKFDGWKEYEHAYLIFTDDVCQKNGERFARYLKKNKFGKVHSVPPRKNPNTGNYIKVWVWAPSERRLMDWYRVNKKV